MLILSERQAAIKILTNLGIWQEVRATQGSLPAWQLKPSFRENLFSGIFEPNRSSSSANSDEIQPIDPKLIEKLDAYATERWEVRYFRASAYKKFSFISTHVQKSILKYIVNPRDQNNVISNSTKEVLKFAGLMKTYDEATNDSAPDTADSVVLTAAAFQFLLWNRKVQVWYFIIQLLEYFWQVGF